MKRKESKTKKTVKKNGNKLLKQFTSLSVWFGGILAMTGTGIIVIALRNQITDRVTSLPVLLLIGVGLIVGATPIIYFSLKFLKKTWISW